MAEKEHFDVTFDFRSDTPPGADPDAYSPTLRRYHRLFWSKPLPTGELFELTAQVRRPFLVHRSARGEFWLTSDTVIPSFRKQRHLMPLFEARPEVLRPFNRLGYTMGGMMLFPGKRVGGKITINAARGFHPSIKDRFDLTLECIRRHYVGGASPLDEVLARYADFFEVFRDFKGYVEFFLLQDLVSEDSRRVEFFLPFQDFEEDPVPRDEAHYLSYQQLAVEFLNKRNARMVAWWEGTKLG